MSAPPPSDGAAVAAPDLRNQLEQRDAQIADLQTRLDAFTRRIEDGLRVAANVQRSLLPPPLNHPRLDIAREFMPYREIGGDYYDLLPLGSERLVFAIGDVMGKGVPAALLAASLKASLRAQFQRGEAGLPEMVRMLNRLFWEVTPKGKFATGFFAVFDMTRNALRYVNAGHHYPFIVRSGGTVHDLREGGTVLGLLEDTTYECGEALLSPGDVLIFYSDGVTDRANCSGELYGVERLKDVAVRSRQDEARIALYTLLGEVQGWAGGTPADDDMTLVVAKVR